MAGTACAELRILLDRLHAVHAVPRHRPRALRSINANQPLLYHRQVTLPTCSSRAMRSNSRSCRRDGMFRRGLHGDGRSSPDQPVKMIWALVLDAAARPGDRLPGRLRRARVRGGGQLRAVASFGIMPICGLFFMVEWLPPWAQEIVSGSRPCISSS
jgi:capsular polysaccharide transport system permease protein